MTTGSFTRSDLNQIHHVVQNTNTNVVKDIIIGVLRDEFSKDSYYHYVQDQWGYPYTPDLTDKSLVAGFDDEQTTRIFIGERFRHDVIFYPAVFVKMGGVRYVPISINRNKETVKYSATKVVDGYGNESVFTTPTHFVFAGAWEGSVSVDIWTRDAESRDELTNLISLLLQDIRYEEFLRAGIAIKNVSSSGPSETQDRQQEPLYKNSINMEVRTEWRREVPVESMLDAINICVEFGNLGVDPPVIAPNLTINTRVQLIDQLEDF